MLQIRKTRRKGVKEGSAEPDVIPRHDCSAEVFTLGQPLLPETGDSVSDCVLMITPEKEEKESGRR